MTNEEWIQGNTSVAERLNLRRELALFRTDPLGPFSKALSKGLPPTILHDELSRYEEAFSFFYLALERYLTDMSVSIQWEKGPR